MVLPRRSLNKKADQKRIVLSLSGLHQITIGIVVFLAVAWFSIARSLLSGHFTTGGGSSGGGGGDGGRENEVEHVEPFVAKLNAVATQTRTTAAAATTTADAETLPNRYGVSPVKLRLPTPVIVVGYPKSGTTSVWHFFNCSGVISQHFCCCGDLNDHPPCKHKKTMARCIIRNLRKQQERLRQQQQQRDKSSSLSPPFSMLSNCGSYDVYAQIDGERLTLKLKDNDSGGVWGVPLENGTMEVVEDPWLVEIGYHMRHFLPQHFNLHQLHQDVPNATFILPLRDPREWALSVFHWFQARGRIINEYLAQSVGREPRLERPGKNHSIDFLARIYQEHSQFIRDFVQGHPSHALVEFHIQQANAGEVLASAFGLPSTCWEQKNPMGSRAKNVTDVAFENPYESSKRTMHHGRD